MKRFGDKSHLTAELLKSIMNLNFLICREAAMQYYLASVPSISDFADVMRDASCNDDEIANLNK